MTHPIERHAINDAATMTEIAKRIPLVLANLDDHLGADQLRASTGGNASGGTGSRVLAAVIAHEDGRRDHADEAWAELQRIDKALHRLLRRYLNLTSDWGYITGAGQARHTKLARTTTDADWCTSCLRIDWFNPRSRGDRCDWCYRYEHAEHAPPPVELLIARHDGKTITETMVRDVKHAAKIKRKAKR